MRVRVLEFYSGIGGLHRALRLSDVDATVIRAYDWDQTSCQVYDAIYGPGTVKKIDISTLGVLDIINLDASCWILSPSCQPYTVLNPVAKGAADPRAQSFLHIVQDLLPELVKVGCGPKWMLVENVAGFEGRRLQRVKRSLTYLSSITMLSPSFCSRPSNLASRTLASATTFLRKHDLYPFLTSLQTLKNAAVSGDTSLVMELLGMTPGLIAVLLS